MADITSNLRLHYACTDPTNGSIEDSGPDGLDLTVTSASVFPARVSIDGRAGREFTRSNTVNGGASTPTNYAQATITTAQMQAILGANNGSDGAFTVGFWFRRTPTGLSESTGLETILVIAGAGNTASANAEKAYALKLDWFRTSDRFRLFYNKVANATDFYQPAYSPAKTFDQVWAHVVFRCRVDVVATSCFFDLFINGCLVESSPSKVGSSAFVGTYPSGPATIQLGRANVPSDAATVTGQIGGVVSSLKVYSRALSNDDIAALAECVGPITPTSALRYGV